MSALPTLGAPPLVRVPWPAPGCCTTILEVFGVGWGEGPCECTPTRAWCEMF